MVIRELYGQPRYARSATQDVQCPPVPQQQHGGHCPPYPLALRYVSVLSDRASDRQGRYFATAGAGSSANNSFASGR